MNTYEALDKAILAAIAGDKSPLYARSVDEQAKHIAEVSGREDFRVIDGRLQALRKTGKIKHHGGKWHITQESSNAS